MQSWSPDFLAQRPCVTIKSPWCLLWRGQDFSQALKESQILIRKVCVRVHDCCHELLKYIPQQVLDELFQVSIVYKRQVNLQMGNLCKYRIRLRMIKTAYIISVSYIDYCFWGSLVIKSGKDRRTFHAFFFLIQKGLEDFVRLAEAISFHVF